MFNAQVDKLQLLLNKINFHASGTSESVRKTKKPKVEY